MCHYPDLLITNDIRTLICVKMYMERKYIFTQILSTQYIQIQNPWEFVFDFCRDRIFP